MLPKSIKKFIPQSAKNNYHRWLSQTKFKENAVLGLWFTVTNSHYKTDGCQFKIPYKLTTLGFRAHFFWDIYEFNERNLIKKYLRPENKVLELGACIGIVSSVTNKILNHNHHVVLEANPSVIPFLKENKELNKSTFSIVDCLLNDGESEEFHFGETIVTGSVKEGTEETSIVKGITLESLEDKFGEFDTLIMDIQGAEIDVLKQIRTSLDHFKLVIVEMHPSIITEEEIVECRNILEQSGLQLVETHSTVETWLKPEKNIH